MNDSAASDAAASGPVVELALRRLRTGQDTRAFETARDTFVSRLCAQPGVEADREFAAVFDYAAGGPPAPPVFLGMTQYHSLDAFNAAGTALGTSAEATSFFATFAPVTFTALRPLDERTPVDLRAVANQPGQVLEVAVRNLGSYASFDAAGYAQARDAFLALLRAQSGFVAEYQWRSALDPNLVVGMTVYASMGAFQSLAASASFTMAPQTGAFLGAYPPAQGFLFTVVR